jgi:hypothetical protein
MTKVRTSMYSVQLCPKLCPWYKYIQVHACTYKYVLSTYSGTSTYQVHTCTYKYSLRVMPSAFPDFNVAEMFKSCYSVYFRVQVLCILGMAHCCIGTPHAIVQNHLFCSVQVSIQVQVSGHSRGGRSAGGLRMPVMIIVLSLRLGELGSGLPVAQA